MTDPFGLMQFAECEHKQLKCEKCGARSDIRGWSTFTGQDKELFELREANATLTARLAEAQALLTRLVKCWGPHDVAHYKAVAEYNGTEHHREMIRILEAAKGGRDE